MQDLGSICATESMQKMHLDNAYRNCIFSAAVCRYDFLLQAKPLLPGAMRQFWHVMLKLRFLFNYVMYSSQQVENLRKQPIMTSRLAAVRQGGVIQHFFSNVQMSSFCFKKSRKKIRNKKNRTFFRPHKWAKMFKTWSQGKHLIFSRHFQLLQNHLRHFHTGAGYKSVNQRYRHRE